MRTLPWLVVSWFLGIGLVGCRDMNVWQCALYLMVLANGVMLFILGTHNPIYSIEVKVKEEDNGKDGGGV